MYLQWTKIDVGLPEFRESNRIFFIFWEACKADNRSYGMCYLKNRRSGFSFMSSSETVAQATITSDARFGILSKSGADAKKMFTDKVVPISTNYPFFFKPIQDGMDKPKTELAYRVPASKLTRKTEYRGNRTQLMNSQVSTQQSLTGKTLEIIPMTVRNLDSLCMMNLENGSAPIISSTTGVSLKLP